MSNDDKHGWTHVICLDCYSKERQDGAASGGLSSTGDGDPCCWCGKPAEVQRADGPAGLIYYRAKTPPKCPDFGAES